jgi:RNA polymerase sigma factor (sigma-70 family)
VIDPDERGPRLVGRIAPAHRPVSTQRLLVASAARGDQEAFEELAESWSRRLFAIAYRILGDWHGADDAVQDALVLAWRDLPGLREPDRFEAWMHRLLVRVCYRQARARRRDRARLVDIGEIDPAGEDQTGEVVARDRIARAFHRLTIDQRTVLVLHHYRDRSLAEIADILSTPEGTVASRLHYATKALRAAIEADERATGETR